VWYPLNDWATLGLQKRVAEKGGSVRARRGTKAGEQVTHENKKRRGRQNFADEGGEDRGVGAGRNDDEV